MLAEWIDFRQATVQRRTQHRLRKVLDRIHVLEGRQLVLLNIDEVIRIIRNADEPKPALIDALQPQRPPGRGHPRDPPAPAGAAGSDQDRAGAEDPARRAGQARRHPRQRRGAEAHGDQGDRGRREAVRRRAAHGAAGRQARRGRSQGRRRAGDGGRQPEGLGAGAEGPRGRRRRRWRSRPATACTARSPAAASTRWWSSAATGGSTASRWPACPAGAATARRSRR